MSLPSYSEVSRPARWATSVEKGSKGCCCCTLFYVKENITLILFACNRHGVLTVKYLRYGN